MNPHSYYQLKAKRLHLAAEARIIRRLELNRLQRARQLEEKYPDTPLPGSEEIPPTDARSTFNSLHHHRRAAVRPEARATHVAAMFLKGVPYSRVEDPETRHTEPKWDRVEAIVKSFCTGDSRVMLQRLAGWRDEGAAAQVDAA